LDNPKDKAQHTLKILDRSMGDIQQRGYNGLLPHAEAEPLQASQTHGT